MKAINVMIQKIKSIFKNSKMHSSNQFDDYQRFQQAIEGSQAVIWEWDVAKGDSLMVVDGALNHGVGTVFSQWSDVIHQDDVQILRNYKELCIMGICTQFECEHRVKNSKGVFRWMITRGKVIFDQNLSIIKIVGMSLDITARRKEDVKLQEKATRDSLTGLLNRDAFAEKVKDNIAFIKGSKMKAVVLFMDLDGFKTVNDTWGHGVGDAVLIETALRLKGCIRGKDSIARLGGDEFGILIEAIEHIEEVQIIIDRIHRSFEPSFQVDNNIGYISISIGTAVIPDDGIAIESLMRCADMAMYQSKRQRKTN